mmetsp:Transcript_10566/g.21780  ORF Transcript_10566/g.21780 Transcript_10566/m.21780 type:complete len:244 (+) Transcript_10566:852-1583(+)
MRVLAGVQVQVAQLVRLQRRLRFLFRHFLLGFVSLSFVRIMNGIVPLVASRRFRNVDRAGSLVQVQVQIVERVVVESKSAFKCVIDIVDILLILLIHCHLLLVVLIVTGSRSEKSGGSHKASILVQPVGHGPAIVLVQTPQVLLQRGHVVLSPGIALPVRISLAVVVDIESVVVVNVVVIAKVQFVVQIVFVAPSVVVGSFHRVVVVVVCQVVVIGGGEGTVDSFGDLRDSSPHDCRLYIDIL